MHSDPMAAKEAANRAQSDIQQQPAERIVALSTLACRNVRTDQGQQAGGARRPRSEHLVGEGSEDAGGEAAPVRGVVVDLRQHQLEREDDSSDGCREARADPDGACREDQLRDLPRAGGALLPLLDELRVQVLGDAGGHVAIRTFLAHGQASAHQHRQANGLDEEHAQRKVIVQNVTEEHRLHLREATALALHGRAHDETSDKHHDHVGACDSQEAGNVRRVRELDPPHAIDKGEVVDRKRERAGKDGGQD
mmetsp:Transcript_93423/g.302459  ORF Transcript_93423/g.302459 Transcript_93423/m.302459 type:complete len:251 (+) Transcript_93423:1344-2096(+)